jgi:hypothetical protein
VENQELRREFTASNDSAIAAFENYKTYLKQELKPKADGDFALGSVARTLAPGLVSQLPDQGLCSSPRGNE